MSKCWKDGVLCAVRAQRRGTLLNPGDGEVMARNALVDCIQRETGRLCLDVFVQPRSWRGQGSAGRWEFPSQGARCSEWGVGRGRDENGEWGRAGMSCTSSFSVSSSFQITKHSTKRCSICSPFEKKKDMVFVLKFKAQWGRQTWIKNNGTNEVSVIEKHVWKLLHMKGNVLNRPSRMENGQGIKRGKTQRLHSEWGVRWAGWSGLAHVHWSCCLVTESCPTLWPHGLQPARLLRPWDFQGKNTGVGCRFLLQKTFLTQGSNLHLLQ